MHGDLSLGGPVWLFAVVLLVLCFGLAVFVVGDALMPRRAHRWAELSESRWVWVVPQTIWLVALFVAQFPAFGPVSAAVLIATPFMLAVQVAYLLRVVFPRVEDTQAHADEASDPAPVAGDPSATDASPASSDAGINSPE